MNSGIRKSAVLFLVFNRLDTTLRVLKSIQQYQPSRLYIAADGPATPSPATLSIGASAAALKAAADQVDPSKVQSGKGFILWFTGLSGAGKSTLAQAVRLQLAASPKQDARRT